jgi:two-component system, NtrC family, sensor histidine kinase HydH
VDLRTQISLIAALISLALACSVLLRSRRKRVHLLFGGFAFAVALWYATTFLLRWSGGPVWERINLVCAVLLPLGAGQFFRAFLAEEDRRIQQLTRIAFATAAGLVLLVFTPFAGHVALAGAIFVWVTIFLFATLSVVYRRGLTAPSRFEGGRLRFLALVGALGAFFTLVDYLPYVGVDIPPVGTILVLIFLYVLSQSIVQYRLLDLYELTGRLAVLTALSFTLATILWALVYFARERFFLHAVVASLVLLLLFDPLRARVEEKISQFFFRERYHFEQVITSLRRRIARVLEVDQLAQLMVDGLAESRRVTHAAVYLVDEDGRGHDLKGHLGPEPPRRIELAPARPLLDRLSREGVLILEAMERELGERRQGGEDREAETVYEVVQTMEAMGASLCLAMQSEQGDLYGLVGVRDDRMRDAFSPEEVQLLAGLAAQAAITVENSRLYRRMKERDRLAALGEMAAGLAHEIRNPLGAIKASAQYLSEEEDPGPGGEFLDIIVDEVDRLNRVVSSFLDYARPSEGDPEPIDVNATVDRTMQLLRPECAAAAVRAELLLDPDLPKVRIDVEQLRQVLINLVQNALQAMEGGGQLTVETGSREHRRLHVQVRREVEIRVRDTGPGIDENVLKNLFVPFVTTKSRGTGLGLAISQRIINAAGGIIEARSAPGHGTTFIVRLPASLPAELGAEMEPLAKPPAAPDAAGGSDAAPAQGAAEAPGPDAAKGLVTSR